jgi:hypothetical protein
MQEFQMKLPRKWPDLISEVLQKRIIIAFLCLARCFHLRERASPFIEILCIAALFTFVNCF